MEPVRTVRGRMAPLDRDNVDTDQIIPKQFLKSIRRTGFEAGLFYDWRREGEFVLDRPEHKGAQVLVAGANFGCGSSREHAAWAIQQAGYRVVIAPSFGDIFRNNSAKTGLLAVQLPRARVSQLMEIASEAPETELTVDLEHQLVSAEGFEAGFEIDPFVKQCLLNGWDDVALSLRHESEIAAYEARRAGWLPVVGAAPGRS
jgi:3-isopropylmalate/(R)-2-methylmalate dehydratase small subunit